MQGSNSTLVEDPEVRTTERPTTEEPVAVGETQAPWGPTKRVLFRFVFVYLVVYNFPFPLNRIPGTEFVVEPYVALWNTVVPWVGKHLFHLTISVLPNGSGDTTFNYVQVLCFAALAAAVTALWTIVDRRRTTYRSLYQGLRIYVRYSLAATMILYGAIKVIKSQFPSPSLDRLIQPFGDASPMGLLWTFMGASQSYNVFTGVGELLGGLLLTTRRTTLLGALVSFGVLSHVAMLNFSYDVPVKLFSVHLLAMAMFLLAPDLGRIARMFLLNRPVEPIAIEPFMGRRWADVACLIARTLVVAGYTALALQGASESRRTFGDGLPRSPYYGIWEVAQFETDGKIRQPLVTDTDRWRRVVFDHPKTIAIQLMSDKRQRYMLNVDAATKTMALTKRDDPAWKASLSYQQTDDDMMTIEGTIDGKKIRGQLIRAKIPDFLLINREFHWINEYPFNR